MNETAKTGVFVAIAAASLLVGWMARPAQPEREAFDDSGERFFEERDPLDANSLEIVSLDADTGRVEAFRVEKRSGAWVIPSHDDYPADAETQLGLAAAAVVDLVKGPKISDRAADFALYGVVDPTETTSVGEGVGTRVKMADASGAAMVDLIIGKAVKEAEGLHYVRLPDRDRVYTARIDTTPLTTRFQSWIEPDLLQLETEDLRRLVINDYQIDEVNQRIVQGDRVELSYDPDTRVWALAGQGADEALQESTVAGLRGAVDALEIIDVVRKPAGLGAELRGVDALELDATAVQSLQSRGYYIAGGSLVSNEGETIVGLENGVRYVLRFGEIALGARAGGEVGTEDEGDDATSARYLFVMAEFDEGLIAPADVEPLPALPDGYDDEPAPDEDLSTVEAPIAALRSARAEIRVRNESARAAYEATVAAGQARVADLNDRFADWYYVISDDVYRKIRLKRTDLVTPIEEEPADSP